MSLLKRVIIDWIGIYFDENYIIFIPTGQNLVIDPATSVSATPVSR